MTENDTHRRRSRLMLLLLFLLFFLPVLAALLMVQSGWRPRSTTNVGQLVQPVQPIADVALADGDGGLLSPAHFHGRWTVLLTTAEPCGQACMDTLGLMSRVHVALNKDADRVRIGLILPPAAPAPTLPEPVLFARAPDEQLGEWAVAVGAEAAVHIVDYRGLRMMTYPVPLDGKGLLKDLRRLLRVSDEEIERHIGQGGGA